MKNTQPLRFKTINEFHQFRGLPKPQHTLISVVNLEKINQITTDDNEPKSLVLDFYTISLKRNFPLKLKYGQQEYDFDEGIMSFISPGQVFGIETRGVNLKDIDFSLYNPSGYMILIHPDLLWNTPIAKTISQYEFFDYSINEALFLSEKEESTIISIMKNIENEYLSNIDKFSDNIIIAQIELLLSYSERFYNRQFITRKITNHKLLNELEEILSDYFNSDSLKKGLPTVQYIAKKLNVSPNYLSVLLKVLTGQNAQQHIHDKLIEKAKEKLSTTDLSVSEIAYGLGFEHSQSFNRLFKSKTNISPLEFRRSFN